MGWPTKDFGRSDIVNIVDGEMMGSQYDRDGWSWPELTIGHPLANAYTTSATVTKTITYVHV